MRIVRKLEGTTLLRGGVVTVGNFDGVHRGHVEVFETVKRRAALCGGPAVVVSFAPHTQSVLAQQGTLKVLTTTAEKSRCIRNVELDGLVLLPFNRALKKMDAQQFLENIIFKYLAPREVVFGHDHRFGKGRGGDFALLQGVCKKRGILTHRVRAFGHQGHTVSSTVIRELVALGRMEAASSLLGRPYLIRGKVVKGYGRGRRLGFPTANLAVPEEKLLMPDGVYYGSIWIERKRWPAVISLGNRPSFGKAARALEAYVPGFSGNLYGKVLDLFVEGFIRGQKVFGTLDALKEEIVRDTDIAIKNHHNKGGLS